jgi:hypothetical protein
MESPQDLAGIDLVWWPTLLRCRSQAQRQPDVQRFTTCLANLARAVKDEEE